MIMTMVIQWKSLITWPHVCLVCFGKHRTESWLPFPPSMLMSCENSALSGRKLQGRGWLRFKMAWSSSRGKRMSVGPNGAIGATLSAMLHFFKWLRRFKQKFCWERIHSDFQGPRVHIILLLARLLLAWLVLRPTPAPVPAATTVNRSHAPAPH